MKSIKFSKSSGRNARLFIYKKINYKRGNENMTGFVKWFNDERGYGFIETDGENYFVHFSSILVEGFKTLKEGQRVAFDPSVSSKGAEAKNVTVLED